MSSRKRPKIKGTPAHQSFAIPLCSVHETKCVRGDDGRWVCLACADEWLKEHVQNRVGDHSIGGVALPAGVKDERRDPAFGDLMPNSTYRRHLRKEERRRQRRERRAHARVLHNGESQP